MTDINSIIEMIESVKLNMNSDMIYSKRAGYQLACDDIIEQLRTMSDWMPIGEAPEEGEFLVYLPEERKKYQVAYYHPNVKIIGNYFHFDLSEPTHFMPLPKPPRKEL